MEWFLIAIVIAFSTFYLKYRKPLSESEVRALAIKRRRILNLAEYDFDKNQTAIQAEAKKIMKIEGEMIRSSLDFYSVPSYIAGFLKYKKHEWIAVAFISKKVMKAVWWNKGPDNESTNLKLSHRKFIQTIHRYNADAIAMFHNHPNSISSYWPISIPSETDLVSARTMQHFFMSKSITLLEFICERGVPKLYYAAFPTAINPLDDMIAKINYLNRKSVISNYKLRRELNKHSINSHILGK